MNMFLRIFAIVLTLAAMSFAQANTPEKQQLVDTVAKLEAAPLDPSLVPARDKAFRWLLETKDVTVGLCEDVFKGYEGENKKEVAGLKMLHTLAMGRFIILHPDQADDQIATNEAGIDTVLNAYRAILQKHPQDHVKQFDQWLKLQKEGKLLPEIQRMLTNCIDTTRA